MVESKATIFSALPSLASSIVLLLLKLSTKNEGVHAEYSVSGVIADYSIARARTSYSTLKTCTFHST